MVKLERGIAMAMIRTRLKDNKPLYSVWFVDTNKTVSEIRDGAKRHTDSNDKIFVAEWDTRSGWASYALPKGVTDWLHNR